MTFDSQYSPRLRMLNYMPWQYNGINLLHDPLRTQFYDKILRECEGKRCVDVGSGSGILAFIALKHGAEHVTCFEQNPKSAEHIQNAAKRIGVSDKINVINQEFNITKFDTYNLKDIDIIFHEIVGGHIWDDMIGHTFRAYSPIRIIPEKYMIRFDLIKLSVDQYNLLTNMEVDSSSLIGVHMGIDIQPEFIDYYNEVIQSANHLHHMTRTLNYTRNLELKEQLDIIYRDCENEYIGTHVFDINNQEHYQDNHTVQFKLPQIDDPYLIRFIPALKSNHHVLDFRDDYASFTGYYEPVIVPPKKYHKAFRYQVLKNTMKIDNIWLVYR